MSKGLLPIGSVVHLEDSEQGVMVIGYYPVVDNRSYDYLATLFPQGMFEMPAMFPFDSESIASIDFIAYADAIGRSLLDATEAYMREQTRVLFEIVKAVGEASANEAGGENDGLSYVESLLDRHVMELEDYTLG